MAMLLGGKRGRETIEGVVERQAIRLAGENQRIKLEKAVQ
jgi:hypothetical protein